ncbi:MAG: wax ester/triacylglycerol synthase domain-containing protein, partial [Phototrophicaceae bacterium]
RLQLEAPADDEQLRELAGHLISSMLDRRKPLWEVYLVEGLTGNRTAIIFKIHHCMVDGLAAVDLFTMLFDLTPETEPAPRKPIYDPPNLPSRADLILETAIRDIPHKFNMLRKLGGDLSPMGNVLGDKEKRRKALIGMANIINDNITPIKKLAINGSNSGRQQVAWVEFSLAEVRAIKSGRGASVNDVMLSVLGAAIERYTRDYPTNASQNFVRVLVPVNMRLEKERNDHGNRISVLPVDVPFGSTSPLDRLEAVQQYTTMLKESSLSNSLDVMLTVPALAPAITQPLVWRTAPLAFSLLAHTWCTNVAGPQIPVYVLGHQMLHSYGFFPLNPSMGLACVVMSYNQRITMTLIADSAIVADVSEISEHLQSAYLALRRAAKVQEIEPIALTPSRAEPHTQPAASAPAQVTHSNNNHRDEPVAEAVRQPVEEPVGEPVEEPVTEAVANADDVANETDEEPTAEVTAQPVDEISDEPEPEATPDPEPEPESAPIEDKPQGKPVLFSEAWAQAYAEALNNSQDYYRASTKWTAGPLTFIMRASPKHGIRTDSAVFLDLYRGKCREAKAMPPGPATQQASFVIEGDYEVWMKVLSGQAQPLPMIVRGKLRLKKGSMTKLLPFTQSSQELIRCAQAIS